MLASHKQRSLNPKKKYRPEAAVAVAMTVAVAEEDEELLSVLENKIFGAKRVLVTFFKHYFGKIYLFSFSFTVQVQFQFYVAESPVSV